MGQRAHIDVLWGISARLEHRLQQSTDRAIAQSSGAQIFFFWEIHQHHQIGDMDCVWHCAGRAVVVPRKRSIAGYSILKRFEIGRPISADRLLRHRFWCRSGMPDGFLPLWQRLCRLFKPVSRRFCAQILNTGITPPVVDRVCEDFSPVLRCDLHVSQQSPVDAQVNCLAWRILSVEGKSRRSDKPGRGRMSGDE